MTRASVIVPAHNAESTLARTLLALSSQEVDDAFEVIVVDDGSTDRTAAIARAAPGPVRLAAQAPYGAAAARNRGVREAAGSCLAFCDADVFPAPGWLHAGLGRSSRQTSSRGGSFPTPGCDSARLTAGTRFGAAHFRQVPAQERLSTTKGV